MYGSTSEYLSYLRRVASHATKEHANGRIDAVPRLAAPPVEYFAEYLAKEKSAVDDDKRLDFLRKKRDEIRATLNYIEGQWRKKSRAKLRDPDGHEMQKAYHQIWKHWKQLNIDINRLAQKLSTYHKIQRQSSRADRKAAKILGLPQW